MSLRSRVVALAAGVTLAPLLWVAGTPLVEARFARALQRRVDAAAAALVAGEPPARVAAHHDVRVRIVAGGRTVVEAEEATRLDQVGQWGSGMIDEVPTLRDWDASPEAPVVDGCAVVLGGAMTVCATEVDLGEGRVGRVDAGARRHLRALGDDRVAIVELVIFTGVLSLGWAWLIGRAMLADVARIAAAAARGARDPLRAAPLPTDGPDELRRLVVGFNTLLGRLQDEARARQQAAADLAHELKQPTATVVQVRDAVLRGPTEPTEAGTRATRLAALLTDASTRLDGAARGFLDLARAESGFPGEARERVDVGALLDGLASTRPQVERTGEGLVVVGVPDALETALRNLLDNACSFGRVVRVRVERGRVVVEDDGPGVPAEIAPRLFEPWVTSRRSEGGTGLGLALSRRIIEAHGGTLTWEGGARFVVVLPGG